MRYMLTLFKTFDTEHLTVTTTNDGEHLSGFPAVIGNQNYDAFLAKTGLTDEGVRSLALDEWIEN